MKKICEIVATLFYSGYSPFAPGTVGTLVALIAVLPFLWLKSVAVFAILTFFVIVIGFFGTHVFLGGKTEDLQYIVVDEAAGLYIAILLPFCFVSCKKVDIDLAWVFVISFVLFRIFDITKPWFIGYVDRNLHGAVGIMMDDVIAGMFGGLVQVVFMILWVRYRLGH